MVLIVDAEGLVLGRLATYVAKQALLGEEVIVLNAEKAIVSGNKGSILKKNRDKLDIKNKGNYNKGPYHQKRPDRYVKKSIRGMLPFKKTRGREALDRVKVYIGVPKGEIAKMHKIDIDKVQIQKPDTAKKQVNGHATIAEICDFIGGRW